MGNAPNGPGFPTRIKDAETLLEVHKRYCIITSGLHAATTMWIVGFGISTNETIGYRQEQSIRADPTPPPGSPWCTYV